MYTSFLKTTYQLDSQDNPCTVILKTVATDQIDKKLGMLLYNTKATEIQHNTVNIAYSVSIIIEKTYECTMVLQVDGYMG